MKKFIPLLAAAALLLCGCGQTRESAKPENVTTTASEAVTVTSGETATSDTTAAAPPEDTSSADDTAEQTSQTEGTADSGETASSATTASAVSSVTTTTAAAQTTTHAVTTAQSAQTTIKTTAAAVTTLTTTAAVTTTVAATTSRPSGTQITAQKKLYEMTLHEKVCQMFIVAPEKMTGQGVYTAAGASMTAAYEKYPVGGFIFFAQNISTSDQTKKMTAGTQKIAKDKGIGAFMAIDEEGGSVTRIQYKLGTTAVKNMSYYGSLNDYNTAYSVGQTIGAYLRDYGFNVDFAPVADVNISPKNELGSRIFSSDPRIVSAMTSAVVKGLHSKGICSTLKHFPGLGAGNGNTHYNTVLIDRTLEQLRSTEFVAFTGGINAGTEFVMVGHQVTTGAGDNLPADLSKQVVTGWLRGELGFNGIAVTDSQSMGAIVNVYGSGEAAVRAVEAGIDIILMPYDLGAAVQSIEQAVRSGRLSESRINESVLRILEKKEQLGLLS